MTMGDRVAVIKDGVRQQVDTPQNLYDHPVNVFVAAFIGSPSMNLFEARIEGSDLQLGSQSISLGADLLDRLPALRAYEGKPIIVGIRPEDFDDASLPGSAEGHVTATVALVEALGSEIMVHFSIDAPSVQSGDPDAVDSSVDGTANSVGRFSPRSAAKVGQVVEVAIDTDNLHFFDPETRLTIADATPG
jgi:multiple sugar transport system ATP-binding protein